MKPLIAVKALTYGTRRLQPGDEFTARKRDARVLKAIGKAIDPPKEVFAIVTPKDDEPVTPPPKRKYQRRALTAGQEVKATEYESPNWGRGYYHRADD